MKLQESDEKRDRNNSERKKILSGPKNTINKKRRVSRQFLGIRLFFLGRDFFSTAGNFSLAASWETNGFLLFPSLWQSDGFPSGHG
jgi:hypothetical protein